MAQKERAIFQRSGQIKTTIRNETAGAFQSVISYEKFRDFSGFCSALSRNCRKH